MPTVKLPSGREIDLNDLSDVGYGPVGSMSSGHPSGWTPAYGAPYSVPDPISSAWKALGGDVDMLPSLFNLANTYNARNYDERLQQVMGTPGYSGVEDLLQGKLPQDVINQTTQRMAERGIGQGLDPTSPNFNAAILRGLGLNSLQAQQTGQSQQNALLGLYPQAAPFDMNQFLLHPDDVQAAALAANVQAAAPNPQAAADEEQRKLLEAIAAGKANIPGGGATNTVDYAALLNALRNSSNPSGVTTPQPTVAAGGPSSTINRGTTPITWNPTQNANTGTVSGYNPEGIRNDVIKNAAANNYVNSIFKTPSYSDAGTLGGLGLDPTLNSVIAMLTNPNSGNGSLFYPNSDFGAPITSNGLSYDGGLGDIFSQGGSYFGQPITSQDLYSGGAYSDFGNSVFNTPSYDSAGSLGGLGLDPTLNALFGSGGLFDYNGFSATTPNDISNIGGPLFGDTTGSYFDNLFGGGSSNDLLDAWLYNTGWDEFGG